MLSINCVCCNRIGYIHYPTDVCLHFSVNDYALSVRLLARQTELVTIQSSYEMIRPERAGGAAAGVGTDERGSAAVLRVACHDMAAAGVNLSAPEAVVAKR